VSIFLEVKFLWERSDDCDYKSIALSQPRYIKNVLRRFGLTECKLAITQMVEAILSATIESGTEPDGIDIF
jgi:hypothetical protein